MKYTNQKKRLLIYFTCKNDNLYADTFSTWTLNTAQLSILGLMKRAFSGLLSLIFWLGWWKDFIQIKIKCKNKKYKTGLVKKSRPKKYWSKFNTIQLMGYYLGLRTFFSLFWYVHILRLTSTYLLRLYGLKQISCMYLSVHECWNVE